MSVAREEMEPIKCASYISIFKALHALVLINLLILIQIRA